MQRLILSLITNWEKFLDSNWVRDCEFIGNLRENSVIRGKVQISQKGMICNSFIDANTVKDEQLIIVPINDWQSTVNDY